MEKLNEVTSKNFNYEGTEYKFFGLPNEHIYKQIPWYELGLLQHLRGFNKAGAYIDVGGNIGNHSLFFLNHCNASKLFVFEPQELCHEILRMNLEANTKKEFVLHKLAVWDKEAELKLVRFETYGNTGMSSVEETDGDDADVKANSLDNLIPANETIGLIKIDAEGAEPKILNGAINTIKLNNPIIICEASTTPEFEEINKILEPLGYKRPIQRFNATPTYVWVI